MVACRLLPWVALLLGLLLAPPPTVADKMIIKLRFAIDSTCYPPIGPKGDITPPREFNKHFSMATEMLDQAAKACRRISNTVTFQEAQGMPWKLPAWMNAAHMIWGTGAIEWYLSNPIFGARNTVLIREVDIDKLKEAEKHLKYAHDLITGRVAGPHGRKLNPKTAALACSDRAYGEATDEANDVDKRVKKGVKTQQAFGVAKMRILKYQPGIMLNGLLVYDKVIPEDLLCPCSDASDSLVPSFTTTHRKSYKPLSPDILVDDQMKLEEYPEITQVVLCDAFSNPELVHQDLDNWVNQIPVGSAQSKAELSKGGALRKDPTDKPLIEDPDNHRFAASLVIVALMRALGPEYDDMMQWQAIRRAGTWFFPKTVAQIFMPVRTPPEWWKAIQGGDINVFLLPDAYRKFVDMCWLAHVIWRRPWFAWTPGNLPQTGIPKEMVDAALAEHGWEVQTVESERVMNELMEEQMNNADDGLGDIDLEMPDVG